LLYLPEEENLQNSKVLLKSYKKNRGIVLQNFDFALGGGGE
jgi:hypothetical protein